MDSTNRSGGSDIAGALLIVFVVLKLTKVIDWSLILGVLKLHHYNQKKGR